MADYPPFSTLRPNSTFTGIETNAGQTPYINAGNIETNDLYVGNDAFAAGHAISGDKYGGAGTHVIYTAYTPVEYSGAAKGKSFFLNNRPGVAASDPADVVAGKESNCLVLGPQPALGIDQQSALIQATISGDPDTPIDGPPSPIPTFSLFYLPFSFDLNTLPAGIPALPAEAKIVLEMPMRTGVNNLHDGPIVVGGNVPGPQAWGALAPAPLSFLTGFPKGTPQTEPMGLVATVMIQTATPANGSLEVSVSALDPFTQFGTI